MTTLDSIPLLVFFAGVILLALLTMEGGFWLGRKRRQSGTHESEAPLGSIIASTLALLAFLLAITFNIAANRFEERRSAVLREANAIGTAFLRADFLDQPTRDEVKKLFRKYVALRLEAASEPLPVVLEKSSSMQKELWAKATSGASKYSQSETYALFIDAINAVIDVHAERVTAGLYGRVPIVVWFALLAVAGLSMAGVGYVCGLANTRSWPAVTTLILSFSVVMFLVADLDRPTEGIITTSLRPLADLSNSIGAP
jgi:hypothetical protein